VTSRSPEIARSGRWWTGWPVAFGLSLAGLAVSAYLTAAHYTSNAILACSSSGTVDCARVTTSAESSVLGVPVAVLGLAWFAAMTLLALPLAWRSGRPWVARTRMLLAIAGMAFVVWLVYAELFRIEAICLWCTVVHVIAFGLFVLIVTQAPALDRGRR
jgi:uncharacterized membrane protein